ncbi:hypothetical protein [Magnetospirillum fulvum]|uniref:Uncharacterized protein n=1 Tax=Magnetospirillum fulvum MGU-K5 TaxID=1316936 RepID=S9TR39_MAGFU|nr:hypothetical protein [Magnetospirillum fulvum]EPY01000.1 hypothetical protein K678_13266 [Magnetospirillum fulvum MGU-K5]
MTTHSRGSTFDNKVGDLLALTQDLTITQILVLRRMTLVDPTALAWATTRELEVVFNAILDRAVSKVGLDALAAAADDQFAALLPPGTEEELSAERWRLFDLAQKYLVRRKPRRVAVKVAPPPPPEDIESEIVFSSFKQLFDECLSRYARQSLQTIVVGPNHASLRPHVPVPFVLAPGFAACYETLLRLHVLPDIRTTRRIRELETRRDWSDNGANRLIGIVQSGERDNPILETWDSRWSAYQSEGVGAKAKRKDDPWSLFAEAAAKGGFVPPTEADLPLLHAVLRWDAEVLAEAWRGITLLYQQEFTPKNRAEQAREGALRDGMVRTIRELPVRAGDMLAVKAFFELPKCDKMFLRRLLQTISGSDTARRRTAPGLVSFYENLPK